MSRLIELVKEGASIEDIKAELDDTGEYHMDRAGNKHYLGKRCKDYIDDKDCVSGFTALMYASSQGNVDIVQLLLNAGADIYVNSCYDTALSLAMDNNHQKVITLLKNHRSKLQNKVTAKTPKSNPTTEFISIAERVIHSYYEGLPTEATEDNCETIKWLTLEVFKELFLKELKKDATAGIYVDFIPKWVNFISHDLDIAALRTLLMLGDGEYICSPNDTIGG